MTDDEGAGEPAGGQADDIELTPAQTEHHRAMASFRQVLIPKVNIPTFTLPESVLENFAAVSGIVEAQQTMLATAIQPILNAQGAWQRQISSVIASDAFKNFGLATSSLGLISTQLSKNIDFGFVESFGKIFKGFAEQQSSWLKNLGPALAAMRAGFYSPNLRTIEGLEFKDVEQVVMIDGIPLYGVPRTATAEALIHADGPSQRREILGRRWKTISADCREAVLSCSSGAVASYVPFAVAALDALDAGHTAAAQALAGSLVDTVVTAYFGTGSTKYKPHPNGKRTKAAYDEFTVREFIAFAPMWQTYQQFVVANGDKVPATFSRHATAHAVSSRQFNRRNAVQGLMFACSLLYRFDEEAAALEAVA